MQHRRHTSESVTGTLFVTKIGWLVFSLKIYKIHESLACTRLDLFSVDFNVVLVIRSLRGFLGEVTADPSVKPLLDFFGYLKLRFIINSSRNSLFGKLHVSYMLTVLRFLFLQK